MKKWILLWMIDAKCGKDRTLYTFEKLGSCQGMSEEKVKWLRKYRCGNRKLSHRWSIPVFRAPQQNHKPCRQSASLISTSVRRPLLDCKVKAPSTSLRPCRQCVSLILRSVRWPLSSLQTLNPCPTLKAWALVHYAGLSPLLDYLSSNLDHGAHVII